MKKTTLFVLFFLLMHVVNARMSTAIAYPMALVRDDDSLLSKSPAMMELLSRIMSVTGLQPNFKIKEARVSNIEAFISHKKRYILYNPAFIEQVSAVTKSKWAITALLAHEIGHHLNGHTIRKSGSSPQLELEADEFAGFVLYKLGASVEDAQEVMNYIAKPEISATHPARSSRMLAIQQGWNKAAGVEIITSTAKKNPTDSFKKGINN